MKKGILSIEEEKRLEEIYQFYLHDPRILEMKKIGMHRGSNTYIHSFKVAKLAVKRAARRKKKKLDLETVLIASILHDYYLYDWRFNKALKKHHASRHPKIAAENAKKDFNVSDKIAAIIKTHMWPINFRQFPKTKEARIVMNADTHVATLEVLTSRRYKAKRIIKYMEFIETLFDK